METRTMKKVAVATLGSFLAMAVLGGCGSKDTVENEVVVSTVPVTAETVVLQEFDKVVTLGGLTAPESTSAVVAKISGMEEVLSVNVSVGDKVTRGQVLAQLDNEMAQINYNNAKMAYDDAEKNYNNALHLYELEAMSQTTLDQLKMARDNAENTLHTVALALEYYTITAPISGTVSAVNIDEGAYAAAGTALFVINDVDVLEISTGINEKDVSKIHIGQEALVKIGSVSDQWMSGTITEISKVMNSTTKNYPITIAFANQSDEMVAGMYAEVQVVVDHVDQALVIPADAIVYNADQPVAYVVGSDGAAKEVQLELGITDGDYYVIQSGLQAGDQVIIQGNSDLVDGTLITVMKLDGAAPSATETAAPQVSEAGQDTAEDSAE